MAAAWNRSVEKLKKGRGIIKNNDFKNSRIVNMVKKRAEFKDKGVEEPNIKKLKQ